MLKPPSIFSGGEYIAIWTKQVQAESDNEKARGRFAADAANWIMRASVARDRQDPFGAAAGDPEPVPPQMTVVADDGAVTFQPFPDLAKPVLPPPNKIVPTATGGFFGGATNAPPADRIDLLASKMVEMFGAVMARLDKLAK